MRRVVTVDDVDSPPSEDAAGRLHLDNQVLRAAVEYYARDTPPRTAYPLVTDLARAGVPVATACAALGFSTQAYYAWRSSPVSDRDWDDAHLIDAILTVHAELPHLGYRLITDELRRRGIEAHVGRVYRLCVQQQVKAVTDAPRSEQAHRAGLRVNPTELHMSPTAPGQLWLTGVTHTPTPEGNVYLCVVVDAFTEAIVGWAVGDHMTAELAVRALDRAVAAHHPVGALVHSNWGSQFRSNRFAGALRQAGLRATMGKIGPDTDETVAESLFLLLHSDALDRRTWNTKAELRSAIVAWVEKRALRPTAALGTRGRSRTVKPTRGGAGQPDRRSL